MNHLHDKAVPGIFRIREQDQFNKLSLEVFRFQYKNNPVYRKYCRLTGKDISGINSCHDIPFLPAELFKYHSIASVRGKPEFEFHSSGTTSEKRSSHPVFDPGIYRQSILAGFRYFYGEPDMYCIIALIPSAAGHPDSSLAYMADVLIRESRHADSGFYQDDYPAVVKIISQNKDRRLFIFGLSYSLVDFAAMAGAGLYDDAIVMETGGMKGRHKEMTREELHYAICSGCMVKEVHSEYSMCELFSQAYSRKGGLFRCPPWMKIMTRDINDPFAPAATGSTGGINIIDLANRHTCSFIATQDIGRVYEDGTFEVLGRFDHSDLRGCSLMSV